MEENAAWGLGGGPQTALGVGAAANKVQQVWDQTTAGRESKCGRCGVKPLQVCVFGGTGDANRPHNTNNVAGWAKNADLRRFVARPATPLREGASATCYVQPPPT